MVSSPTKSPAPIMPEPVTKIDLAFPARGVELMPDRSVVPEELLNVDVKWLDLVERWFFSGFPDDVGLLPKDGIDPQAASEHIAVVIGCYGIKHEDKMAGAALLMSLWFDDIVEVPPAKSAASGV